MKTAEEILKENCPLFSDDDSMTITRKQVIDAMRDIVTQEVGAYKERLKQKLEYSFIERSYREGIEKIIDTTK